MLNWFKRLIKTVDSAIENRPYEVIDWRSGEQLFIVIAMSQEDAEQQARLRFPEIPPEYLLVRFDAMAHF